MLSPADRALVARDPALPSLALLLDDDALSAWLTDHRGAACRVRTTYLRYKAGTSCVSAAELTTGSVTEACVFWGHARHTRVKLAKTRRRARSDWLLGQDDRLGLLSTTPAADRDIPALGRLLTDTTRGADLLAHVLPRLGSPTHATVRRLRHKPGRRWVGTVTYPGGAQVVLRLYPRLQTQTALAGVTAWSGGTPRTPRLLGVDPRRGVVAVEYLPGIVLSDPAAPLDAFEAAGAVLARLHGRPDARLGRDRVGDDAAAVETAARNLAMLLPDLAEAVHALASGLADRLRATEGPREAIHGDFAADQVVLDDEGTAVIDLDAARWGDPAADLGCAMSALVRDRETGRLGHASASRARNLLLAGYASERPLPPPARLAVQEAAYLLRRAAEPFRLRWHEDWDAATRRLVARAQQAVAEHSLSTGGAAR